MCWVLYRLKSAMSRFNGKFCGFFAKFGIKNFLVGFYRPSYFRTASRYITKIYQLSNLFIIAGIMSTFMSAFMSALMCTIMCTIMCSIMCSVMCSVIRSIICDLCKISFSAPFWLHFRLFFSAPFDGSSFAFLRKASYANFFLC